MLTQFNECSHSPGEIEMKSVITVFNQIVKSHSKKTALVDNKISLTYSELDKLSNKIANLLKAKGIKHQELVGISLPKSSEAIATIIAILKLGAVYVPISTENSQKRFQYVIDNGEIKFFIIDSSRSLVSLKDCTFINLEQALRENQNLSETFESQSDVNPSNPAYVIYTSGTTGEPKGVIATHRGILNLVCDVNYVKVTSQDVFLQLSPLEFDGSTFDIWGALLNGATLILMPPGWPELEVIAKKIRENEVSILFVTTQLFNALVDFKLSDLLKVAQVYFGGESASTPHIKKFMEKVREGNKLYNIYGPTECTTFSTYHQIREDDLFSQKTVPIGKPIGNNVKTIVLSGKLEKVKPNEIGELFIGGFGVSPGYLNDKLTSEKKFIKLSNLY